MEPLTTLRDDDPRFDVGFPFRLDGGRRVASPAYAEHVEQMIEQLLFTTPGERVNRPDFGCGLLETLFSSLSPEEVSAIEYLVQGALQRWLGDVIEPDRVLVEVSDQTALVVEVRYALRGDGRPRKVTFRQRKPGGSPR